MGGIPIHPITIVIVISQLAILLTRRAFGLDELHFGCIVAASQLFCHRSGEAVELWDCEPDCWATLTSVSLPPQAGSTLSSTRFAST